MRQALSERTTTVAGWVTLTVTLAVCGLGLKLTALQYQSMSGILLDAERRSAESARTVLESWLDEEESRVLARIMAAPAETAALAQLREREPLVEEPFVLFADGRLVTRLGGHEAAVLEAPIPPLFEKTMTLLRGPGSTADKILALRQAAVAAELAPEWQRLALAQSLALQTRSGQVAEAVDGYQKLLQSYPRELSHQARPSYFEVVLALGDALALSGDLAGAGRSISDGLERIASSQGTVRFAPAEFFLREARNRLQRWSVTPPLALSKLDSLHHEHRVTLAVFATLKEWVLARTRVEQQGDDAVRPYHHLEERALAASATAADSRAVFIAWSPLRSPTGTPTASPAAVAVGFRVNLSALGEGLRVRAAKSPNNKLVFTTAPGPTTADFIELAALPGERSFVRLGLNKEAWDQAVREARRPFLFAGILTVVLMVLVVLGLLVFLRGVRQEMLLSRMKTEFVANVSHELKTPLALIRLFGETLLLGRGDPANREKYCRIITRESERLTHLISSVLSFASIEAGKKNYQLGPCDLAQVVRETYESYRFHLDEKGFTHRLEVAMEHADADATVLADANAVTEAIINLLENAVKYSQLRKDVTLRVESKDDAVCISVRDQGVGIAPEDQAKVFEDYYRTKEARAMGTRGSGLGLSLVRHILEAHGGRVELKSRLGEGSEFRLVFPSRTDTPPQSIRKEPTQVGQS